MSTTNLAVGYSYTTNYVFVPEPYNPDTQAPSSTNRSYENVTSKATIDGYTGFTFAEPNGLTEYYGYLVGGPRQDVVGTLTTDYVPMATTNQR